MPQLEVTKAKGKQYAYCFKVCTCYQVSYTHYPVYHACKIPHAIWYLLMLKIMLA